MKRISECSFENCSQLKCIEINEDSELQFIGNKAFSGSQIKSIFLLSHVMIDEEKALSYCNDLKIIEIVDCSLIESKEENDIKNCINTILMVPFN